MNGIQAVAVPSEENVVPPESELEQQNDYIKQVATPLYETVYHPGVISITMRYTKDAESTTAATYNLTFKDMEGGNATVSQSHEEGDAISAITLINAPANKTFKHWSTEENGETAYSFGTMPEQDVTLYAVWQTGTVRVTTQGTHSSDNSAAEKRVLHLDHSRYQTLLIA